LPNIWEVCDFSDEIRYGNLDISKFAVEFHSILDDTADPIYKDPKQFLSKTYLTSQMKSILVKVLLKIVKDEGNPVYVLDTEFGGGKTHTLVLLYHIFKNKSIGTNYIQEYKIDKETNILEIPDVRVSAIDCSSIKKKTFWGEIAYSMDKYELLRELDEKKEIPKDITLLKRLFDKPTLLLIDELPIYLQKIDSEKIGNVTLAELTITFIQELIKAISSVHNSVFILTLTASQKLYEQYVNEVKTILDFRRDNIYSNFKESLSRQAQYIVPVNKEEVSAVLIKRLIKKRSDNYKNIVEEYYNYYNSKGLVDEPNYKDKMLNAYPFHPFLIDILYDRVSSLDNFNKTRGALRLLSLTLHDIYKNRKECEILSTGDIDLSDSLINESLTGSIGKGDLKPAIESDCIDKARRLDKGKSIQLAEKIARTIYLYSLIGSTKISGITSHDIKLAVSNPKMDHTLVDKLLEDMDKEFWYLKVENGQYYFHTKPNLNKIIYEYTKSVNDADIKSKIKYSIKSLLQDKQNNIFKVYLWDEELPDDESLKLYVIDYNDIKENEECNKHLFDNIIRFINSNIRTYQNTIVLLTPDSYNKESLINSAKNFIAAEKAKNDERIKMDSNDINAIKQRIEEFKGEHLTACRNTYSKIAYPYSSEIRVEHLQIMTDNIITEIKEVLKKKGKLVESINPDVIADKIGNLKYLNIYDIYKEFTRNRNEKFIVPYGKILDSVKEGVANQLFGYSNELNEIEGKYKAEIGRYVDVNWDGYLINKEYIYQEKPIDRRIKEQSEESISSKEVYNIPKTPQKEPYRHTIKCDNINDTINKLVRVNIATIGKEHKRSLNAILNKDGDTIEISSNLTNIEEMKSLLKQLSSLGFNLNTASIEIITDEDIKSKLQI